MKTIISCSSCENQEVSSESPRGSPDCWLPGNRCSPDKHEAGRSYYSSQRKQALKPKGPDGRARKNLLNILFIVDYNYSISPSDDWNQTILNTRHGPKQFGTFIRWWRFFIIQLAVLRHLNYFLRVFCKLLCQYFKYAIVPRSGLLLLLWCFFMFVYIWYLNIMCTNV